MSRVRSGYFFSFVLILAIVSGGCVGYYLGPATRYLKPVGDIFLNLLLTALVPLIFFSVAAAIAKIDGTHALLKIFSRMLAVFIVMSLIAALVMLVAVHCFPLHETFVLSQGQSTPLSAPSTNDKITALFSAANFSQLLSHEHMLALIVFALLVGLATFQLGEEGKSFGRFLCLGSTVFFKVITLLMYCAPLGFFAYFAVLVANIGPQLLSSYVHVSLLYYSVGGLYFLIGSSLYAYLAAPQDGIKRLWSAMLLPALTSLATCSSAASIPVNLQAAKKMGVSRAVYETVIPLGGLLHKDGSVLGAMVKIAFLFSAFHADFTGVMVVFTALGVAMLVGTVMGAIPSGGMLGEMVILSVYGFPPEALMIIAAISIIIDPLATMLNVTGNTVASLLVARLVDGKGFSGDKDG